MKYIKYNLLGIFFIFSNQLSAQFDWNQVVQFTPSQTMEAIDFVNDSVGYTAGALYNGSYFNIHKTTDGGQTWTDQNSGFTGNGVHDIFAISEDTVVMCSNYGKIIRTTDGGQTWDSVPSGTSYHLRSLFFFDQNEGYCAGDYNTILYTADGGGSWTAGPVTGQVFAINDIYFMDRDTGFVIGFNKILRTSDAGASWTVPDSFPNPGAFQLQEMVFPAADAGFISADIGQVYKTTDGGRNWILLGTDSITTESLQDISAVDKDTVYVCGFNSTILKTTDGGANWSVMTTGITEHLRGIDLPDAHNGYISTQMGKVIKFHTSPPVLALDDIMINSIRIFPNPSSDEIRFADFPEDSNGFHYQIIDISGKICKSGPLTNKRISVDQLEPGTYFVEISSPDGSLNILKFKKL